MLVFFFFYIGDFTAYNLQRISTYAYIVLGFILLIASFINIKNSSFDKNEIKNVLIIMAIYSLFITKDFIFRDIKLYQVLVRVSAPFVVFWLLMKFGKKNESNTIYLTRCLGIFLLISFSFLVFGRAFLGNGYLSLRHFLYGNYYDTLLSMYSATSLTMLHPQMMLAGLSPHGYLFGYQLAGGVTLLISLFFSENRSWRVCWGLSSIIGLAALIMTAERSTIPAIAMGLLFFLIISPGVIKNKIFKMTIFYIIPLLILISVIDVFYDLSAMTSHKNSKKLMPAGSIIERFNRQDKYIRLQWQLAAVAITLNNPAGLFFQGIKEENWGRMAEKEGYAIRPDARGEYEFVHNGYLRIVMYFGWVTFFLMFNVIISACKKIKYVARRATTQDTMVKTYGAANASSFVALLVQAIFHNDSLFSIERFTWIVFILLLLSYHYAIKENKMSNH